METPIIVALIAGGFAVVAPIVTFVITRSYENRFLQPISSRRAGALVGTWEGDAHQEFGADGQPFDAKVTFKFTVTGKKIQGQGIYRMRDGAQDIITTFIFSGGFLHERFIRFDYNPEAADTVQFGSIILELSNDAKSLKGRYLGYGVRTNGLVYGTVDLKKVA